MLHIFAKFFLVTVCVHASPRTPHEEAESLPEDDRRDRTISDFEVINTDEAVGVASTNTPSESPSGGFNFGRLSWFSTATTRPETEALTTPSETEALPTPSEIEQGEEVVVSSRDNVFAAAELFETGTTTVPTNEPETAIFREPVLELSGSFRAPATLQDDSLIYGWLVAVVMAIVAGIIGMVVKS